MEIALIKTAQGYLAPMDEGEGEKLKRFRAGSVVRGEFAAMRNGPFFRKWWTLVRLAFSLSSERMRPMEYKGQPVQPNFDRFRKDITIMAGYYDPVFGADGSVRMEARSLQWSKMKEDEFTALYSATIDTILQKVLPHLSEDQLENAINATLSYA